MDVRILGPLEVRRGDVPVRLGAPRQRKVLAMLVLHANEVVARELLIHELWGAQPSKSAEHGLEVSVSLLRGKAGIGRERLITRTPGYMLRLAEHELDAARFERLVAEARSAREDGDPRRAEALLGDAQALWRGPPLADFTYDAFAQPAIARLLERRTDAREERVEAALALGRHAEVIAEIRDLVRDEPFRERPCRQLMLALYRCGRQADALDAFQHMRQILDRELGLQPGAELRELYEAILRQDPALLLQGPPAEARSAPRGPEAPAGPAPPTEPIRSPVVLATRRTATVLAAVLEGRAASGRADPEPLRRLFTAVSEEARRIVEGHGGMFVSEREPEVVFGVFGAPKALEEDVLRALRAAGELCAAAQRVGSGEPVTLDVRVGVATGLVIVETTPGRPSIVGDPMPASAALARRAEDGQVLLSDATYQLAREAIRAEALADAPGWRLHGLIAGAPAVPRDLTVPMVGRDRELALAQEAFERAVRAREAQLLTVIGEAGLGKSRLAAALEAELATVATVLTGHCLSYGEGVAFWPLREAIAQAAGGESRDAVRTLVGDIADADLVTDIVAGAVGLTSGEGAAEQLPWAFRRLLEALAERRPLVLVIEDAHWAEPPLLELLDHLIDWLGTAPVLLLCLARPELLQRRPELAGGRTRVASVVLEPLGEADALRLLEHQLTGRPLDAADRRRILATAEGNPLFVEQLLATRDEDPAWGTERAVPATLQGLLAARLDRLGDGERACLGCAAVVGREFWLDAVLDMLAPDFSKEAASDEIAALVHRGLIRPHPSTIAGEQGMRFHHVLIRDVAYEAISLERRSELHERLADWLEARAEGFDEFVGHHLERAFEYRRELRRLEDEDLALAARAAERLADAGRRVLARGDSNAAVALLRRSAALLEISGRPRPRVLLDLGATLTESGEFEDAERILGRALAQAQAAADERMGARVLIEDSYRRLLVGSSGGLAETLAIADRAIEAFRGAPEDHAGLSHAYMHKAHVQWTRCRGAEMEAALEAALKHAERAGEEHERAQILGGLARAAMIGPRHVDDGVERCHAILGRGPDDVTLVVVTEAMLAVLESMRGRFSDAHDHWSTAVRRLEGVGLGATLAPLRMYRGFMELMAGTPERAEAELTEAYELLSRIGERHRLPTLAAVLARVLYAQGRYEETERYTTASALASRDDIVSHMMWRGVRAKVLARAGEGRTAEELADAAVALAERTDFLLLRGDALIDRAEVRRALGQTADAVADLDDAIRLYERKGVAVSAAAARRLRESLRDPART